ncbi:MULTISPECIES: hypothetical protein [unclassified Bacillus (in: firmicutes)]|uniref:hypothetical protein n=1 Tax=unclassified Bacillus (in: firmicutes) TaxID=185979 RepID=UPI001C3F28FB|nr:MULTISPECIES: hypothetical protein [unclassified Bacillus (in: firmicutes)]
MGNNKAKKEMDPQQPMCCHIHSAHVECCSLLVRKNTSDKGLENDPHNLIFDFKNHPYFASLEYVVPFQVLTRKLSLDLGIDCNISSDPGFHKKMGSNTY